jgi:outer membrane autotransporter protein
VTGGSPILTATGTLTGYTSKQAKAAGLPSDFVTVLHTVNSLPTRASVISSLHQVTAEPYASMQSVALEAMEQFRQNSLALSDGDRAIRLFTEAEVCLADDGSLIPADNSERPSDCKPRKLSQASRWSLLIDATNTQAGLEGTNDLASLDYNIFQSTYGLQYDASKQWSIGAAFGYGQANLYNYEYANSSISSDTYGGSIWGVYRPSAPWKITGLLGYTNFQYDSNRSIAFGGLNRNATANWSGNGFTTALEAEYDWILSANKADRNAIRLKPNTYVAYSLHNQGNITESGAESLNLAIDGHTADSLVYGIGFTLETPIQIASSTRLIPRLSVGYEHDFNANTNEEHQLTASFTDVPALGSLDVLGQNRGANDLNVALNVELETSDQFSLYAGVGGSFWSNGNELNYGGGLRWRFGGAPKATIAKAPVTTAPAEVPTPSTQTQTIRGLW